MADTPDRPPADHDTFWRLQARRIDWRRTFDRVCDTRSTPSTRWYAGGTTNLCHNAVDRHMATRPDQIALVHAAADNRAERTLSYGQLYTEVQRMAAILQNLGVRKGDRVLLCLPMIPEAVIAMLATVRLGAIHTAVSGGLDSTHLSHCIDDARPALIITCDAGLQNGQVITYKPRVDTALEACHHAVPHVLLINCGQAALQMCLPRDVDCHAARREVLDARIPCEWVDASHPSQRRYPSSSGSFPQGAERDTGSYAVHLATTMAPFTDGASGETLLCTSDIHGDMAQIDAVYGALITGMSTVLSESPSQLAEHEVSAAFASPTAMPIWLGQGMAPPKRHRHPSAL